MNLSRLAQRSMRPEPWSTGDKIPWNEPAFSGRMLEQHLSQAHDRASRRFSLIDQQIKFITQLLSNSKARVLDLGCGPGLYTERLARLGHDCVGVDFSPASIEYAKKQAARENLTVDYRLGDIRSVDLDRHFDLVLVLFGELNVFRKEEARAILRKAAAHLSEGGLILAEVHTFQAVYSQGLMPPSWKTAERSVFSERPHLWLQEHFWNSEQAAAITRHLIIDIQSAKLEEYGSTMLAYTDEQYGELFESVGLQKPTFTPAAQWNPGHEFVDSLKIVCSRRGGLSG